MKWLMSISPSQLAILKKSHALGPAGYAPARAIEQRSIDCLIEKYFIELTGTAPPGHRFAITPLGLRFLEGASQSDLVAMYQEARAAEPDGETDIDAAAPRPTAPTPDGPGDLGPAINQEAAMDRAIRAGETGRRGEASFAAWLACGGLVEGHGFRWVSQHHAYAPYDFEVSGAWWEDAPGGLYIDVKATTDAAGGTLHLSLAEARWAATHPAYRIARVTELGQVSQKVSILAGVHELTQAILESVLGRLPNGVTLEGFEIEVGRLTTITGPDGLSL